MHSFIIKNNVFVKSFLKQNKANSYMYFHGEKTTEKWIGTNTHLLLIYIVYHSTFVIKCCHKE